MNRTRQVLVEMRPELDRATWATFAAQAMNALLAGEKVPGNATSRECVSRLACDYADSMMAELEKRILRLDQVGSASRDRGGEDYP